MGGYYRYAAGCGPCCGTGSGSPIPPPAQTALRLLDLTTLVPIWTNDTTVVNVGGPAMDEKSNFLWAAGIVGSSPARELNAISSLPTGDTASLSFSGFGSTKALAIHIDSSGNIYVGYSDNFGSGGSLQKFNSSGISQWTNFSMTSVLDIDIDSNGDVVVSGTGSFRSTGYMMKVSPSTGSPIWGPSQRTFGSITRIKTAGTDVYAHSRFSGDSLMKIDVNGNIVWSAAQPPAYTESDGGLDIDSSGHIWISGGKNTLRGTDGWVAEYDSSGTARSDFAHNLFDTTDLQFDSSGGLYITGGLVESGIASVRKFTTGGAELAAYLHEGPTTPFSQVHRIRPVGSTGILMAGTNIVL